MTASLIANAIAHHTARRVNGRCHLKVGRPSRIPVDTACISRLSSEFLATRSFCRAASRSRLATLRGLLDGFVALQVRLSNAHERHQKGDKHQRKDNGSFHLLSLPSLSLLWRGPARRPVLRVLAELPRSWWSSIARTNLCATRTRPRRDLNVTWPSQGTFPSSHPSARGPALTTFWPSSPPSSLLIVQVLPNDASGTTDLGLHLRPGQGR